jgi:hypothetical protein
MVWTTRCARSMPMSSMLVSHASETRSPFSPSSMARAAWAWSQGLAVSSVRRRALKSADRCPVVTFSDSSPGEMGISAVSGLPGDLGYFSSGCAVAVR